MNKENNIINRNNPWVRSLISDKAKQEMKEIDNVRK